MTADIIAHPAIERNAIENARTVLYSREGVFTEGEVLAACEVLETWGEWPDCLAAAETRKWITNQAVRELNRLERERRDEIGRQSRAVGWLVPAFVLGVGVWVCLLTVTFEWMGW